MNKTEEDFSNFRTEILTMIESGAITIGAFGLSEKSAEFIKNFELDEQKKCTNPNCYCDVKKDIKEKSQCCNAPFAISVSTRKGKRKICNHCGENNNMQLKTQPTSINITFNYKDYWLKKNTKEKADWEGEYMLVHRIDMSYAGKADQEGLPVLYIDKDKAEIFRKAGFSEIMTETTCKD